MNNAPTSWFVLFVGTYAGIELDYFLLRCWWQVLFCDRSIADSLRSYSPLTLLAIDVIRRSA